MIYEHISDYEHYEEGHIALKHSLIILKKLDLNFLFAIFYVL